MVEEYRNYHGKYLLTLVFTSVLVISFGILAQNVFADTVSTTISLGNKTPQFIGVNPVTNKIYVSDSQNTISVINGSSNNVTGTITGGFTPYGIGVNPNTNKIFVAGDGRGLAVIDGKTDTISSTITIVTNSPTGVSVNPNTGKIYVTNFNMNTVSVTDELGNFYATISVGNSPDGVAVNPATNKIYVANLFSNTVSVIDGSTDSVVSTIPAGTNPGFIAANPITNKIYVTLADSVAVIDGSTDSVVSTIPIGSYPQDVAVNPNTNKIYVANYNGNNVPIIDGVTNSVVSTIVDNGRPFAVGINPNTNTIYVANSGSRSITVIDGSSSTTVPSVPQSLTVTAVSSSKINLSWTAPSNDGGSPISGYMIERSNNTGTTWSTIQPNTGSTATTYNDTGLAANTTYTYRVSAINSVGTSVPSNTASATTQQAPVLSVAVLTNKQSYPQNSTVYAAVAVRSNSSPISGASVTIHVCNPNNGCMTGTGTTNSNGNAIFKLAIPPNALTGTYTVDATVSKSGYVSGTGKTTFQVT